MKKPNLFYTTIFLIFLIASLPLVSAYSLTYDANGNLVTGDGKFRTYDGFNHLVEIRNGTDASGLMLEQYEWHPTEDRIVAKHVYENGTWKETVIYASKTFVVVKNATGEFRYKYIYQNGQLVAQQNMNTSEKLFFHNDNLGSVGLVTNESGAKVEETFYEPFGKIISGGATSRFDYEAKEFDSVVGDYDFHARKYDPNIGWTQPDTLIQNIYDPQSLNRYNFERENPLSTVEVGGRYGRDVHYDLTYDFGLKAGLNANHAEIIAFSNQDIDDNRATDPQNPTNVVSGVTTDWHFRNRDDAKRELEYAIASGNPNIIGNELHAYQDTYSHEGLSWKSHIKESLFGKNPDNTMTNPQNTIQMKVDTAYYSMLTRYVLDFYQANKVTPTEAQYFQGVSPEAYQARLNTIRNPGFKPAPRTQTCFQRCNSNGFCYQVCRST